MKKSTFLVSVFVLLGLAVVPVKPVAVAGAAKGEETVKVTILKNKPVGIMPDTITVKNGATIVWVNKNNEPVKIKFKTCAGRERAHNPGKKIKLYVSAAGLPPARKGAAHQFPAVS